MRPVLRYYSRELAGFAWVMLLAAVAVARLAPLWSLFRTYLCMMPTLCIWLPAVSQPMGVKGQRNLLLGFGCKRSVCFWGGQFYTLALVFISWLGGRVSLAVAGPEAFYAIGEIRIPLSAEPVFLLLGVLAAELMQAMQFLPQKKWAALLQILAIFVCFIVCGLMTAFVTAGLSIPLGITPVTVRRLGWALVCAALGAAAIGSGAVTRFLFRKVVVQP